MKKSFLLFAFFSSVLILFSCSNEIDDAKTYLVFAQNSRAVEKSADNLTQISLSGKSSSETLEKSWEKWSELSGEKIEIVSDLWEFSLTAFLGDEKYSSSVSVQIEEGKENIVPFVLKKESSEDESNETDGNETGKTDGNRTEQTESSEEESGETGGTDNEKNEPIDDEEEIEKISVSLKNGSAINEILKALNSSATAFAKSETNNTSAENYLDEENSKVPVWLDGETIYYYYPEDCAIKLNEDSSSLFSEMNSLVSIDLSSFDTSNVTDMNFMFNRCFALTELNLSNFDTSNVTDMSGMFNECKALATLNLSNFDTSNVTNMYGMFNECNALATLDLSRFDTNKVTDMDSMFNGCTALESIYVASGTDWSGTSASSDSMFAGCEKLPNYDSSNVTAACAKVGVGGYFTVKE